MRALKPMAAPAKGRARKPASVKPPRLSPRLRRILSFGLAGLAVTGALIAGTWWLATSGIVGQTIAEANATFHRQAASSGLAVAEIFVTGRSETGQPEILKSLNVKRGQSILAFDPANARQRLLKLGWVKDVRVERRLPDTVIVYLEERRPLALWQRKGRHLLIDREGVVITRRNLGRFSSLPVVLGKGAPQNAANLMDMLAQQPALFTQVEAAVRIGDRRWNLRMKNGIDINLPEEAAADAWTRLANLVAEHRIFDRDVAVIDLRLPDRLVVRLAPNAASKRRLPEKDT